MPFLSSSPCKKQKQIRSHLTGRQLKIGLPSRSFWCGSICSIGSISQEITIPCTGESLRPHWKKFPVFFSYSGFCSRDLEMLFWFSTKAVTTTASSTKTSSGWISWIPCWTSTCWLSANSTLKTSSSRMEIRGHGLFSFFRHSFARSSFSTFSSQLWEILMIKSKIQINSQV